MEIYINIIRDLILLKENNISFLEDLINALKDFINRNNNDDKNILYFIMSLVFEIFLNNFQLKSKIQKSAIFLKLLNYKSNDDFEKGDMLINFLSNIYKNNITINILYKEIYKEGILNLNYYSNSLNLLSSIIKEENIDNTNKTNFMLKNGFYIKKNNPIILENLEIKEKEFSIIFSFRLLNDNINGVNNDDIIVFSFTDYSIEKDGGNIILEFILFKEDDNYHIKIAGYGNEWNVENLSILKEKDYFICLSKNCESKKGMKLDLFINDIGSNSTLKNKERKYSDKKSKIHFLHFENNFQFKERKQMKLILGEKNFEGIIGDFFMINKNLKDEDISQLLNLNGNYSYIAENIDSRIDLIKDLNNFYSNKKEILIYFKKLNYECILKILSDNIKSNYIKGNEIYIDNSSLLINKSGEKIDTFKLNNTLNNFINGNGIDFLVFQMHHLFNIFQQNNIEQNDLDNFNSLLYNTLQFYYDIIIYMNNGEKENIKLYKVVKFDYFFLTFLSILYYYKKINKNLRINSEIYNILLEFVSICESDYYDERNLILSILLDDSFFDQKKILKEGKILQSLDFILSHSLYDEEEEQIFDTEILYKIFNLQFIFQSKDYNHKLYMKIILELLMTKRAKIIKKIFIYIINLKEEDILYHFLKTIFVKFKELKKIITEEKNIFNRFRNFLRWYSKNIDYKNSKYSFKLSHLISLFKDELKIKDNHDTKINIIENTDIPMTLKIKYIICEIKTEFINCFDLENAKKFNFVKNYDSIFVNKNHEKNKDNTPKNLPNNKSSMISLNSNLIKIIDEKKFFSKFDSIIKSIDNLYYFFCENKSSLEEVKEDLLFSIFEMMKYFFQEIINYRNIDNKGKKIFFNIFNKKNEMKIFFKIYLLCDFSNAISNLKEIMEASISEIKCPFYYDLVKSDFIIDLKDANNNQKIKDKIIEILIEKVNHKNEFKEIINYNKEKLLLIIYEKVTKEENISKEVEKFILAFILSFNLENIRLIQTNYFYLIEGEYYIFFELLLNILFEFYHKHESDESYNKYVKDFLISKKEISFFCLNDKKLLKNDKEISETHINLKEKYEKKLHFTNILNVLYFLIYFLSLKNNNPNPNEKEKSLINNLIEIFFNNCMEVFDIIIKKKQIKKFIIKTNIPKLEMYNYLYNIFTSKEKKDLTIEKIENYYKQKYENKNIRRESLYDTKKARHSTPLLNDMKFENKNKSDEILDLKSSPKASEKEIKSFDLNDNNSKKNSLEDINDTNPLNRNDTILEEGYDVFSKNNVHNFEEWKRFDLKSIIRHKNIPLIYYKKIIKNKQSRLIKKLANPKSEFFWKTFIFSLKDMIFYNKNFIKLTKSFNMFSRNYVVEKSSPEEDKLYLNYPTKMKNFVSNEYYRPFLKPAINFFNSDITKISHNYVSTKKFEKIRDKDDFNKISFIKYIPINYERDESQEILCENISYRGSILGKLFLKKYFLAFFSDYLTYQSIVDKSQEDPLFFIYSFQDVTKHVNIKLKTIFIYYKDIKEIIIRRFFLKRIGYEIFLKDGRSYLFNFFNLDNFNRFQSLIEKKEVTIINDLVKTFEKREYKNKFKKGEISNFVYLLLLNKFSTRTYNDINQYLVFPLLYLDLTKDKKRDLSKAICLNKPKQDLEINKYIDNFKILGYYFNNHYSTSAYVLYYLVRVIPYTHLLIDFQSLKFDIPERIFNNYNSYSSGILGSSENRELIPELFHNFEICLNLNHNNIGKMNFSNDLINNFNSNRYKTSIEFIINHRKALEKANIVPWINNIFGCNQINDSKELMNLFPTTSYEQLFNDNVPKIKEKNKGKSDFEIYQIIRLKIAILDIGITPVQMFKSPHPEKNIGDNKDMNKLRKTITNSSKSLNSENNINNNINKTKTKKEKEKEKKTKDKGKDKDKKIQDLFSSIIKFTNKQNPLKYKLYINNETMNLFFIYHNKIIIHNIINVIKSDALPKIKYPIALTLPSRLINLEFNFYEGPSRNIICELMPGFYCICRNENKTLNFINFTQEYNNSFLWSSVITSIEPKNKNISTKFLGIEYNCQIFFGDEEGFLGVLEYSFDYIFKNSEIKFKDINILKKAKIHENCVNNILYKERLNVIISSSLNGDIAINNAYSLEIINMIKIGTKYLINNIKISLYDLLYVSCYNCENKNYCLKCYTLNGLKVTKFKTKTRIVNFLINDYINILYENKDVDKFCLYDFKNSLDKGENEDLIKEKNKKMNNDNDESHKIIHCIYCNKITKILNIYDNSILDLENFSLI